MCITDPYTHSFVQRPSKMLLLFRIYFRCVFLMFFLLYSCLPYSLLSIIVSHNVISIDTILHCIVESFHIIVFYFEMWYAIAFEVKSVLLRSV